MAEATQPASTWWRAEAAREQGETKTVVEQGQPWLPPDLYLCGALCDLLPQVAASGALTIHM